MDFEEPTDDQTRSRGWCMTINNYTEEDVATFNNPKIIKQVICYVYGYEVAPTTGTPHLQCFIYYANQKYFSEVKKHFKRARIVKAKTTQRAFDYCKKGEQPHEEWEHFGTEGLNYGKNAKFVEHGECPKQGKRTDLAFVAEQVKEQKLSVDEVALSMPYVYHEYGRTLHKIEDIVMRKKVRDFHTMGIWYYGLTGSGKSKIAFKDFDSETHYVWNLKNNWNDGYTQQPIVIIDDFRGQLKFSELLNMCDINNTYFAERRGRERLTFMSKEVIITSSLPPQSVYKNLDADDKWDQFYRRFRVYHIETKKLFDKVLKQLLKKI